MLHCASSTIVLVVKSLHVDLQVNCQAVSLTDHKLIHCMWQFDANKYSLHCPH